jgi:aminodeoxyfutalosine deaminase
MKDTAIQPPAFGGDDDWLVSMPKADLHVHLVGSAAPATVAALAARYPDSGVPADTDQLSAFYRFRDFAHFIDVYELVSDLVRDPEDLVTLVAGLAGDMIAIPACSRNTAASKSTSG